MPTQRAVEITNAFMKYAKTGDESIIKEFTRKEIEVALLQYHLDMGSPFYIAMENRIEELKEEEKHEEAKQEKWYKNPKIVVSSIVVLLAAFISGPHWWSWLKKDNSNFIEESSNLQTTNKRVTLEQLSSDQLGLVREIWKYQKQNKLNKVVINRNGYIFDDIQNKETNVNLALKVLGQKRGDQSRFENLMLSIPTFFLKQIPEMRLGNPYVVIIPEDARKFLDVK